jgi:hypothetical protein
VHRSWAITVSLLLAFFVANNLHLPILQVVAWSGMLVSYSRDNSLAEAIEMTFDGENPCPMCIKIKEARASSAADAQWSSLPATKGNELWVFSAQGPALGSPAFTYRPLHPARSRSPQDVIFPPPDQPPIRA